MALFSEVSFEFSFMGVIFVYFLKSTIGRFWELHFSLDNSNFSLSSFIFLSFSSKELSNLAAFSFSFSIFLSFGSFLNLGALL